MKNKDNNSIDNQVSSMIKNTMINMISHVVLAFIALGLAVTNVIYLVLYLAKDAPFKFGWLWAFIISVVLVAVNFCRILRSHWKATDKIVQSL